MLDRFRRALAAVRACDPNAPAPALAQVTEPVQETDPRRLAMQQFARGLDTVARTTLASMKEAPRGRVPYGEDREAIRKFVFDEVKARVYLFCVMEVQNHPAHVAAEYEKAWTAFETLWGIMAAVPVAVRRKS